MAYFYRNWIKEIQLQKTTNTYIGPFHLLSAPPPPPIEVPGFLRGRGGSLKAVSEGVNVSARLIFE